jgi:asparagine synthase (glutamine-hydrolysing)
VRRALAGVYEPSAPARESARRAVSSLVDDGRAAHLELGHAGLAFTGGPVARSATPFVCVVDGVIDNLAEIGAELRLEGPLEATLAEAYARWGPDVLGWLRGRFALVIGNREDDEVLLAVDQLGSRPLFTATHGRRLFWASEIRNLLHMLPRQPAPDRLGLTAWLGAMPLPPEHTLYEGIRRVPGSHAVSIRDGRLEVSRYWSPHYRRPQAVGRDELVPALRHEVEAAVRRQSLPGRTGVLMSGGLDSTAVAGIATKLVQAGPRAYSAIFPGRSEVDESAVLEQVTRYLEITWTRLEVESGSALREMLEFQSVWRLPNPSANLYFHASLSRRAGADGVAALLDGEGGDELFGCVPYLVADRIRNGRLVDAVRLVRRLPWDGNRQPWRVVYPFLREFGFRGAVPCRVHEISSALRPNRPFGPEWLSAESRHLLAEARDLWPWKRLSGPLWWRYLADVLTSARERVGIHDFLRRAAGLGGVERGHPFLDDLELIEFMLRVPPELVFDPRHSRPALREAVSGIVPDAARLRPQKATFTDVVGQCFAGPEREHVARLVTAKDSEIRALLAPGAAEEVLARLTDPRYPIYTGAILRMVSAECFLRSQSDPAFADRLLEQGDLPRGRYRIVSPQPAAVSA